VKYRCHAVEYDVIKGVPMNLSLIRLWYKESKLVTQKCGILESLIGDGVTKYLQSNHFHKNPEESHWGENLKKHSSTCKNKHHRCS